MKNSELQNSLNEVNSKYSKLQEKHSEDPDKYVNFVKTFYEIRLKNAEEKFNQINLKYAEMEYKFRDKNREITKSPKGQNQTNLKNAKVQDEQKEKIEQQSKQINQIQDQISDLKKSCEIGKLKNLFTEEIEKLREIIKSAELMKTEHENNTSLSISKSHIDEKWGEPIKVDSIWWSQQVVPAFPDHCPSDQSKMNIMPSKQSNFQDQNLLQCVVTQRRTLDLLGWRFFLNLSFRRNLIAPLSSTLMDSEKRSMTTLSGWRDCITWLIESPMRWLCTTRLSKAIK